ncbi:hypothetical protein MFIFM68171_10976 [Madurella fahalii]|uniref:Uncharacterized protein n=1 Tax=Madurella fahalii TaxID=1157608 RepID=A0ABQ0GSP2_9PEZI
MLFTATILSTLLACSTRASSVPLEKREIGGVLICAEANAGGLCEYAVYELETCHNLPEPLIKNAATFAPDEGPFFCYPRLLRCEDICRSPTGCTFGAVSSDYPNKFNLTAIGWDTLITSFRCHLNESTTEN